MFVSGSIEFIANVSLPDTGTHVFWLSHASRRIPTSCPNILWTRICHRKVGGVTEARGTFGICSDGPAITLPPDLVRTLGHVLKHSIRPRACDADTSLEHYVASDLLSLSYPRRPILYSTHMSRSGWGMRELTDLELSSCFELPDFVNWDDRFLRDISPIQMFRSVIECIMKRFTSPSMDLVMTASPTELPPPKRIKQTDSTWLHDIGKWLPGSWTDAPIADKAVKSDDAPVDFTPWHRRVQLVLPCSVVTINTFERFAARRWRLNVCRSFCLYIKTTYGENWHKLLSKRLIHAEPSTSSSSKRLKSSMSVMSQSGGRGGGVPSSSVSFRDRGALQTDLLKGLRVVGQSMLSTW